MRHLLMISVLMLSASWAMAQNYPSQSGSDQSASGTGQTMGSKMSVEGCLSGSDGNYMLTDKSGMTYQLTGDTAKLSEHVGHEIKVMGTESSSGSPEASSSSMGKTGSEQTIDVTSFKHISKTCSK